MDSSRYYRARGFSTYYLANVIFNVVTDASSYLRGIEDILGDMQTAWYAQPFKKYTNLHGFARSIIEEILTEDVHKPNSELIFLSDFMKKYGVPIALDLLAGDGDALSEALAESKDYDNAIDELTDEVFHVLFNDVGFLQAFNELCAGYIQNAFYEPEQLRFVTQKGFLRRTAIPSWARKAIYHRDKGECRQCKKSLAKTINQIDSERYDHIVPLACFGANDVTNLQLLCEPCNLKKSANILAVSQLYQKALQP